jgi:hypothetical protein
MQAPMQAPAQTYAAPPVRRPGNEPLALNGHSIY